MSESGWLGETQLGIMNRTGEREKERGDGGGREVPVTKTTQGGRKENQLECQCRKGRLFGESAEEGG